MNRTQFIAHLTLHGWSPFWTGGEVGIEGDEDGIAVHMASGIVRRFIPDNQPPAYKITEWVQLSDYTLSKIMLFLYGEKLT